MSFVRAAALAFGLLSATMAHATVQRTFVASTGNDANTAFNCSLAKPCRGFAAAIGVTSAKGEVIALDSAAYGVIPAITQSVTITAPAGIYAGISVFSGDGITINAGGTDTVVLRGLTINGQGGANGITITNALMVHVENCVIANMVGIGINQVKGLLDVKDTIVRNNGNIGVYVVGPAQASLDHVRLEANNTGLAAEFGGQAAMQDSIVTASPNIGVLATNPAGTHSQVTVSRSLISSNAYGIYADGNILTAEAIVISTESTISSNGVGVHVTGDTGVVHLTRDIVTLNGTGLEAVAGGVAWIDGNNMLHNFTADVSYAATSQIGTGNNNLAPSRVGGGSVFTFSPFTF